MKLRFPVAFGSGLFIAGVATGMAAGLSLKTQPEPQTVPVGYRAYFAVEVADKALVTFTWRKNGVPIPGAPNANACTTPPLTLADDGAVFNVVINNAAGSVRSANDGVLTVMPGLPRAKHIPPFYKCATNYFVATTGDDHRSRAQAQNPATPWKTISHALTVLEQQGGTHGGVCVNVADGVYPESVSNGGGGFHLGGDADTPTGYFVVRAQNPHGPTIQVPAEAVDYSDAFRFADAKFVVIDGFVLVGDHSKANRNGAGIDLVGSKASACVCHHIRIYNNVVHDFGSSGIAGQHVDYVEARGNVVFNTSVTSQWGVSAINFWHPVALDAGRWGSTVPPANAGFHLILGDSVSFNNAECDIKNVHWDGNGIQLDDFNGTQTSDAGIQPYPRPTLVENNLCFANGGAGIMTGGGGSSFITMRSNTCYDNNRDEHINTFGRGEILIAGNPPAGWPVAAHDNVVTGNIAVARPGAGPHRRSNAAYQDASVSATVLNHNEVWKNNLSFNGKTGQTAVTFQNTDAKFSAESGNQPGVDPLFTDPAGFDFTLLPGTPAAGLGATILPLEKPPTQR